MKANPRTPAEIFGYHLRYVVPLFQRPYVWTEKDQWEPLWNDVRTLADRMLDAPSQLFGAPSVPPHFLGAIVVEQQAGVVGFISVWHVVDGQQRLTTLQLLLDAAQEVTEKHGADVDAQALKILVLNEPNIAQHPDEVYKVWPTDRDQDAFRATMDNATAVPAGLMSSPIALAHKFFVDRIIRWAEVSGDPEKVKSRMHALVLALRDHLRVVVIDLEPGDNAQVIFETLNHRGSRLMAADLVKNLVFQCAQAQGLDVGALYRKYWRQLDDDHWRELTAQGRLYRPRIDVFLNYWLIMKLRTDVPSDHVFADFRDKIALDSDDPGDLLAELAKDAAVFVQLDRLPADSVEGLFYYRVVRALDSSVVTPVLIWLFRWSDAQLPANQRHRALRAIESWLVRRALARLTSKGVNQAILDLLKALDEGGPAVAGETTETFFSRQGADADSGPTTQLFVALSERPIYTAILRPRLRMLLEALEDDLRSDYGEGQPCARGLSVEHIMPQGWRENWSQEVDDPAAEFRRDRAVQRLGNMTLVSGKLNSALSHRPWISLAGKGKHDYLMEHTNLKLNARVIASHPASWTEADIAHRTEAMIDRILIIWPRSGTAQATSVAEDAYEIDDVIEPVPALDAEGADVAGHAGKYRELWRWLRDQDAIEIPLSFAEVEQVIGMVLPPSARNYLPHWYGYEGTALGRAIRCGLESESGRP